MPTPLPRPRPFSMLREFHLADGFTRGRAVCGVGALFFGMSYLQAPEAKHVHFACALVAAALVFDVLDGRPARWRRDSAALGRKLDSVAEAISFGVGPAALGAAVRDVRGADDQPHPHPQAVSAGPPRRGGPR